MVLPPENFIPAQVNVDSKLTATVEANGKNQFDFTLTSK